MNRSVVICFLLVFTLISFSCSSESKTLKVTPGSLDFEQINIGDSSNLQITLKNKYGKDLTISNITLNGSGDYLIVTGGNVPINLLKNDEQAIQLSFTRTSACILESLIFCRTWL